ncbi:unnamed protein product [Oikopleura dioica]|uniref:SANT domain-containing protein n=1 Tax=Oikopleura dioica TaxID=34765 RepID=E4XT21_OIKDI|nr:unnamed protein product [Oikopleura dioica]
MDSDASASQSTRGKTQKELRSGKKVTLLVDTPTLEPPEKKKRSWESWSFEEKNCFFDAIKVHRRDFEQIKKFMFSRLGKNGTQKNKDQIRHMYYRTLGTIQKSLTDSQLVYPTVLRDKLDQEFYAMTAYAELRKKMQKDPPRKLLESKLEELLKTQQTVVKSRGKSAKVKIPTPAERPEKLATSLEKRILEPLAELRLSPEDCYTQRCIQAAAASPRLVINIPIRTKISEVKKLLAERWDTIEERITLGFYKNTEKMQSVHIEKIEEDSKSQTQTVYFSYSEGVTDPQIPNYQETEIVLLLLTSKSLHLTYRFLKDRPFVEPVSLLVKCASLFAEALTTDASSLPVHSTEADEAALRSLIFPHSVGGPSNSEVSGARRKRSVSNSSGRGKPKKSMAVNSIVIEQHLQLLNGLNGTGKSSRSPAYNNEVPEVPIHFIREEMPPVSCDQNSNSSISNILHSVLNEHSNERSSNAQRSTRASSVSNAATPSLSSGSTDDGLATNEIDSHVGLMMSENSVGFARATNFYDILENDIPS